MNAFHQTTPLSPSEKECPPHGLDTVFRFGKYKGISLREVMLTMGFESRIGYIDWCIRTVDGFSLDKEAFSAFVKQSNERDERIEKRKRIWLSRGGGEMSDLDIEFHNAY